MAKEDSNKNWKKQFNSQKTGGGIYFMGMIASAIYFIQHTEGFWLIVLALLKAIVWPVFIIYRAFELMGM